MKPSSCTPDPALRQFTRAPIDWSDAAAVARTAGASSLAVARACFSGASRPMRAFLIVGWKGLMLEGRAISDTDRILGWPIVQAAPVTVLQRRSRLGIEATLVFAEHDDVTSFSTGLIFCGSLARPVWTVIAPVHRWAVRSTLRHAVQKIDRERPPAGRDRAAATM